MNLMVLLCLATFIVQLDTTMLYVAFPAIQQTFPTVSQGELAWVLNIYTIIYGSALIPAGANADQWGRKRFFLAGISLFTIASVCCGFSQSVFALIAFRGLQALGAALLIPSCLALLLASVPKEKRAVAVSIWGATGALASAVGPSFGAMMIQYFGWRSAFYINFPIGLFAIYSATRYLTESREPRPKMPSVLASIFLAAGIICVSMLAMEHRTATADERFIYISAAVVSSLLFLWFNQRTSSPAIDFTLFKNRTTLMANLAAVLFLSAFSSMFLGLILFATRMWNYSTFQAGLAITPGPLTVIPTALLAGKFAQRYGHRRLIFFGGMAFAAGILQRILWPASDVNYLVGWLPGALLIGLGIGLVVPSLSTAATFHLPKDRYAMGSGIHNTFGRMGSVCGVILVVLTVKGTDGFMTLFSITATMAFLAGICGLFVDTAPRAAVQPPQSIAQAANKAS